MSGAVEGEPMPGPDEQDERWRRARLAHIRRELLAPVGAIAGYADILRDEAGRLGLEGMTPDLDRILAAGGVLLELVERLLDLGAATDPQAGEGTIAVQERLRHDLRNPLSAIKGYGEMLLEDLDDLGGGALRPDLDKLQAEVTRLLANLDVVVDLSDGEAGRVEGGADPASAMVADLFEAIRPGGPDEAGPRETGRILVVDDNASNRDLLARRLGSEGHRTIEAASGREALRVLESEDVDLVLLDLIMPDMNGLQVLRRLKADRRLRTIPVVMISGLREIDSVIRCIEAGAEDYLPKPWNPVLLRARVGACLEKKRLHDQEMMYLAEIKYQQQHLEEKQERIDQDLRIARDLQAAILPTNFSDFPASSIAALMRPAYEMGGDFYDVFRIAEGRVGLVIADVSGKGVAAAFFMAVTRTMVRNVAVSGATPAQCMAKVNDALCGENPADMFVTAFYAELEELSGSMTCVNAGHCDPVVASAARGARLLERSGNMALGVLPGLSFRETTVTLAEGETLFLYTDGVTEAFDRDGNPYDVARLLGLIRAHAGGPPAGMIRALIGSIETFSADTLQSDDITCLAIRRNERLPGPAPVL